MPHLDRSSGGAATLREMREFASFPPATQRYVRRSLDIGLSRGNAVATWSRDTVEASAIRAQAGVYRLLTDIRAQVPATAGHDELIGFYDRLVAMTGFDLGQGRLSGFAPYRFLYERLLGARVRPWLPGAFTAAAMLPSLDPRLRKAMLETMPEAVATAPGWSDREPAFFPEWVDKSDFDTAAA